MDNRLSELVLNNPGEIYNKILRIDESPDQEGNVKCICPNHNDVKKSLIININDGRWNCFSCQKGGKNPVSFYSFAYGTDMQDSNEELRILMDIDSSPIDDTFKTQQKLLDSDSIKKYLAGRKISSKVIKDYKLGWDGLRITIPIYNWGKNLVNIRKHLKDSNDPKNINEEKTISAYKGLGALRIFPIQNTKEKEIYIFEGELDCLCAISNGLNGVTVTGGAGSWNVKLNKYFNDKKVFICYDNDKAGKEGARKIAQHLIDVTQEIYIINLPSDKLNEKEDFTDFIVKYGAEEFKKIKPEKFDGTVSINSLVNDIHLAESASADYFNKRIKTTALITGKDDHYNVPKKVTFKCTPKDEKCCESCNMRRFAGSKIITLKRDDINQLKLYAVTDAIRDTILRSLVGINSKCQANKIEINSVYNLEEVVVIPEIDYNATNSSSYISRLAYIISDGTVDTNKPYILEGLVTPHPKTQRSTVFIYKNEATKDNIDDFEITPLLVEQMKIFQASSLKEMHVKNNLRFKDYEAVTGIFGRKEIMMGIDLLFHSVLSFQFQNRIVNRGYLNILLYGDTRQGKSAIVDGLMGHFRAGDSAGGENVSFAGLVGGVQQMSDGSKWGITWKIIPLNDRRAVKIDEFHQMDYKDIGKLSELMSTGVANIQKVASERTMARTRLVFVANCREDKDLEDYQYGCQAIPSILGYRNEDIARIDFAIAVASKDVDVEWMNQQKTIKNDVKYFTSDLCHALVMWAWSRKASDVIITPEAEELIVKYANEFSKVYHTSIPLVPPAEQAIKFARLSVACAANFFSTDETAEKLIVKDIHVEMVKVYLERIYNCSAMEFDKYSKLRKAKDTLKDEHLLDKIGITNDAKDLLLAYDKMNLSNIEQIFLCTDREEARLKIMILLKCNGFETYGLNFYRKTPAFMKYLTSREFGNGKEGKPIF